MKKKEVGSKVEPEDPVSRGGGWSFSARGARAANRFRVDPAVRIDYLGLRLVRSMEDTWKKD